MRMSDGVEWAMHCALVMASLDGGCTLSARDLADYHGISPSYLLKHLKSLVKAGLLASVPGPRGGYRLERPPEAITLLDIVEAIEGPVAPFVCTEIRQRGPSARPPSAYRARCHIHAAFREAERDFRSALGRRTLADVIAQFRSSVDPAIVEQATRWVRTHERPAASEKERA